MDPRAHLDALRLESERFGRAARGPLDAPVPSCPEWTLGDLVWHLAGVQFFWEQVVRTRATDRAGIEEALDRPDDELPPWFDEVSAGLVKALEDVEAGTRVWSWAGGEQDVAWVARRQAHEAAVHRWDAQRAIGEPTPIASDLAADGIDEFFEWMIGPEDVATLEGSVAVRLSSPDAGRVWTWARPLDRITGRATPVDVSFTGSASDLLLLLWRRLTPEDVKIAGDPRASERFLAIADLT